MSSPETFSTPGHRQQLRNAAVRRILVDIGDHYTDDVVVMSHLGHFRAEKLSRRWPP